MLFRSLLLAAAPLHAQPGARRPPTCVEEASVSAGDDMARLSCAGAGTDADVRLTANLPRNWQITWADTADLVVTAMDGDNALWVVGGDQLPDPVTRADTANFWRRAAELTMGRDVSPDEVEDFRDATNGRIASARDWATRSRLADSALVATVAALSAGTDSVPVLEQETGVRMLAGEPAGYLSERVELGGVEWRFISYATYRDGTLFLISLNTLERDHAALLPLYARVLASFNPRTERW